MNKGAKLTDWKRRFRVMSFKRREQIRKEAGAEETLQRLVSESTSLEERWFKLKAVQALVDQTIQDIEALERSRGVEVWGYPKGAGPRGVWVNLD